MEDRTPPAPKSIKVPILIAGAILVVVSGGYALWFSQNGRRVESVAPPPVSTTAEAPAADSSTATRTATDTAASPPVTAATAQTIPATAPGDSVRWERARVRSDVNLRKTASRDGESLKVLRIDQPVELGGFQEGWRQVRLGTMIGWADPRNFEIVPRKR